MSSLSLYVRKLHLDTSMGAVATLQQVADDSGNPVRGSRIEITIPANNYGNPNPVDVAPGRWLVEATLPSGEIITTEVAVESGKNLPVPLQSVEHSPREWLSMQHLVGNIEGEETLRRLNSRERVAAPKSPGLGERYILAQSKSPAVRLSKDESGLRGAAAWRKIFAPAAKGLRRKEPYQGDTGNATWLYHVSNASPGRHLAHVEWFDERYAVALPLPWRTVRTDQDAPAEIMVGLEPIENKIRIGVVVEDPDFAPMAGLMTAATLPKAAIAFDQARDLLLGKTAHPLGATAGAYVLLAAGKRDDDSWHSWIDNLTNWFPRIPDGAIVKASMHLRFPKSKNSAVEAKASLLEAFDRGIPYYSAGISWLLDGLTQFADDPAVAKKLKLVHRVALRLDVSQAFTVIRTGERTKR
jgi:hypothetical protein